MVNLLVVDDEELICQFIKEALTEEGYLVDVALSGELALNIAQRSFPDIVLLDYNLPDQNGIEVLKKLRALDEGVQVLMLTGYKDVKTALDAIRNGATDYILKPIDIDAIKLAVSKVAEKISLRTQIKILSSESPKRYTEFEFIICPSQKMTKVYELATQVAHTNDTTVLILGESGTGKEHIAKFIHHNSSRKAKPFVEINCAAIPDNLIEAELFGYEPGAFTDARSKKIGLFEYADGGTIFLDEIGDMPLNTQSKVLKLIESKSFRRVGGLRDLKSDVRIVAATNKDLQQAIDDGKFREDLYYRLQVIPIELPPLRDRPEDILQLSDFFLSNFCQSMRKKLAFSDEATEALLVYPWKGNVRELKNVIERAVIISPNGEKITPNHLALGLKTKGEASKRIPPHLMQVQEIDHSPKNDVHHLNECFSLRHVMEEIERKYILEALQKTDGNQLQSAKLLGIERHVLRYQMKKLGIDLKNDSLI